MDCLCVMEGDDMVSSISMCAFEHIRFSKSLIMLYEFRLEPKWKHVGGWGWHGFE